MRTRSGPKHLATVLAASCSISLLSFAPVHGQDAPELPADQAAAVDAVFADIDPAGPGCAVGVIADRELAYGAGYGMANLDYGIPITTRSNFYLGSVGKQFTAAAVVHAARAGHLSLDDPLTEWFPEMPAYADDVTIRHLVHHTSGIRDYLTLSSLAGIPLEMPRTPDDIVELLARQRAPNFEPGERYLYSNSGYFLLAETVERATGSSLREYAEEHVLEPLGMERTRIHDDRLEPMPDRVVGYELEDGEVRINHAWSFDQVGSGGVWSSVEELVHWDRNYYTEEVGGPGFTGQLLERGVLAGGDTIPYAFGIGHGEYRGLKTVGHGGALAGFRSHLLRFPEQETTVVALCNFPSSDPGARVRAVADVVLADELEPEAVAPDAEAAEGTEAAPGAELSDEELDAFVGHWRASVGVDVEIRRDGDGLVFVQGESRMPVTVVSPRVLRLEPIDVEMTFSDLRDGRYHHQDVVQGGQEFTATRFDPDAATERDFSGVVGTYYSDELDVRWRLFEADGELRIELAGVRETPALLRDDGRIRVPFGFLDPEREDGRVVGFTVDAGRAQGVRFERVEAPGGD